MRAFFTGFNDRGVRRERDALRRRLEQHLARSRQSREELCGDAVAAALSMAFDDDAPVSDHIIKHLLVVCDGLIDYLGLYEPVSGGGADQLSDLWHEIEQLKHRLTIFEDDEARRTFVVALAAIMDRGLLAHIPNALCSPSQEQDGLTFPTSVATLISDPSAPIMGCAGVLFDDAFDGLGLLAGIRHRIEQNYLAASGITDPERTTKQLVQPDAYAKRHGSTAGELAGVYLAGTPLPRLLDLQMPFSIDPESRFTHTHVLGGSGHGKTQALQRFELADLGRVKAGQASLVVIDSQGDMLDTITHLAEFDPDHPESMADRLILIDPNDIEHPPCLNLFDVGLDRLDSYSPVEREKLMNGAIALYEYMFGALLGATLTARQGVIFRYLARLLMVVPDATIHTLRHFMEQPEATRAYLNQLDGSARTFFETQFLQPIFDDTRQQILTRLWGVLSNPVLERMFVNKKNKVDVFDALNSGKVLLINTAKDLLKQDGCEILGRFFIALIVQAIQERAAIPAGRRMDAYIYIDEVQDYFSEGDKNLEILFSQARKYRAGITIANQTLGQFPRDLLHSVLASTAIKMVGGMSAKDAGALAKEMRCEPEFLLAMRKHERHTEFACHVKNVTERPLPLAIPFGTMERQSKLSAPAYDRLRELNRAKHCAGAGDLADVGATPPKPAGGFDLGDWEGL